MSSSVSLRVFVWIYLSPSSVRSWQTAPSRVVLPLHLNVQQPRMRRHMNEIQTSLQPPPMRPTHVTCAVKVAPQKRSVDLVASLRFASVRRHHLVNFPTRPFTALSVARSYMSSVSPFVRLTAPLVVPLNALLMILLYIRCVVAWKCKDLRVSESTAVIIGKYLATWLHSVQDQKCTWFPGKKVSALKLDTFNLVQR